MNASGNFFDDGVAACGYIHTAWNYTYILVLPIFLTIFCVGFQECRKLRFSSTTHSDIFTFNMAAFELLGVVGHGINIVVFHTRDHSLLVAGENLSTMTTFGQNLLHTLVCLERYLAVVHPITYLHLKKNGEVIRNVSMVAVWLSSLCLVCTYHFGPTGWLIVFITSVIALVAVSFLCAIVLFVLIRPGPGERGGDRRHVDQSKRRAFYTIAAVTVALMLKFVTMFLSYMIYLTDVLPVSTECLLIACFDWFCIPSSLVMPLLFLYRRIKQHRINPQ